MINTKKPLSPTRVAALRVLDAAEKLAQYIDGRAVAR